MPTSKKKRKPRKAIRILLLPIIFLVFVAGWCMYCSGRKTGTKKARHSPTKTDNVTFIPIVFEENREIPNK